jgi:aspartate carbamoyltransferase catalytic subunit
MSLSKLAKETGSTDHSELQLDERGRLRHLLSLRGMDRDLIITLLDRAETFLAQAGQRPVRGKALDGKTVANLFFENSTRTRASFELAAKRLGADVLNLDLNTSSAAKGESILDTIYTLQAMQVDMFVVRDRQAGTQAMIARNVGGHVNVLNAGESNVSHPTQGLLDLLTIRLHKGDFTNLTVAIVGDVAHSRVAMSAAAGLIAMGVGQLRLVAPDTMPDADIVTDIDAGIADADVVMALRIQKERFEDKAGIPDDAEYFRMWGITRERMKLAAGDAIVMHPGPMNRGVEIESALADGPASVITEQVRNGVAVRMAVLEMLANNGATG